MKKPNGYWTFERCLEISLGYDSIGEFKKSNRSVYATCCKNKWLDEICKNMKYNMMPNNYWNYDRCKSESLKYETRLEFQKKSKGAYDSSRRKNWLDELCSHMRIVGHKYSRCIYVFEFKNNSAYIGLTHDIKERKNDHLIRGKVHDYIQKNKCDYIFKQLTDYIPVETAQKFENDTIDSYKLNGWNIINIDAGGGLGCGKLSWTFEKCKTEALKYNARNEFRLNKVSSYNSARKNGWLDEICSHMKSGRKQI